MQNFTGLTVIRAKNFAIEGGFQMTAFMPKILHEVCDATYELFFASYCGYLSVPVLFGSNGEAPSSWSAKVVVAGTSRSEPHGASLT